MDSCDGSGWLVCRSCDGLGDLAPPQALYTDPCEGCGGEGRHACACEDCAVTRRWGLDLEDYVELGGEGGCA